MPEKSIVIWGAGRVGRGYASEVFSAADYRIILVDQSKELIDRLRIERRYTVIKAKGPEQREERIIDNYAAFKTTQSEEIAAAVAATGIILIAVFPQHLPAVAQQLVPGILRRQAERISDPLNILLSMNLTHAAAEFETLLLQVLPLEAQGYAAGHIGIVETVPMRVVSDPPVEEQTDPLLVWTDGFEDLPVSRPAFKGDVPNVPGLVPVDDIQAIKTRKLYTYNMCHAVLAYLGALKDYTSSMECLADPCIRAEMEGALHEVSLALRGEYHFDEEDTAQWNQTVISRTENPVMGDAIARLGGDPRRKLRREDRLVGPALLAHKHGIRPVYLTRAIAAGFMFHNPADPGAVHVQQRVAKVGLAAAIREICELSPSEYDLVDMIVKAYYSLPSH